MTERSEPPAAGDEEHADKTEVVPRRTGTPEEAATGHADTITAPAPRRTGPGHSQGRTHTTDSGRVGAAVPEPADEPSPELRAQMFKPPLDARRKAPASPFPADTAARPHQGVRSSMPVIYGRRTVGDGPRSRTIAQPEQIGAAPAGYALTPADRDELPSLARMNRRFGVVAFAGGAAVSALAVLGLSWIATQLI